jgi:hypothetical protein
VASLWQIVAKISFAPFSFLASRLVLHRLLCMAMTIAMLLFEIHDRSFSVDGLAATAC